MMMITINGKPADVKMPEQPLARRKRLREIVCDAPAPPPCYRIGSNGKPFQRGQKVSNFARPKPETPVDQPSAACQRKWRESRQRVEQRLRLERRKSNRVEASVQCGPLWPEQPRSWRSDGTTQTDFKVGGPLRPAPAAATCRTSRDTCTQVVYRNLVDFETEAFPLVEALVAKTLEGAAVTVLYEDNAAATRRERAICEANRLAECIEVERLEYAEGLRRQRALRALAAAERADPVPTYRALHSRTLAAHLTNGLCAEALARLESAGYLFDDVTRFTASLLDRSTCRRDDHADVRLDELVGHVIANRPQPPRSGRLSRADRSTDRTTGRPSDRSVQQ